MLRIGDDVILTVTSVRGGSVRLGFEVPADMIVDREEVAEQKKRARVAGNLDFAAQVRVNARPRAPNAERPASRKTAVKSSAVAKTSAKRAARVKRSKAAKRP